MLLSVSVFVCEPLQVAVLIDGRPARLDRMTLTLRPTGLGSGIDKDRADFSRRVVGG